MCHQFVPVRLEKISLGRSPGSFIRDFRCSQKFTQITPPRSALLTRYHRNSLRWPITQVLQLALKTHGSLPIGKVISKPGRYNVEIEALERNRQDDKINWITAIFMGAFHVGAIAALFFFTWKAFFVACFLWWVSGSLGIGMGYHRLLTHRGYKTPKWVEYFLTVCATLALEG